MSKSRQAQLLKNPIALQAIMGWPIHPATQKPTPLYDYQERVLLCPDRFILVNKSRKIGLTETLLRRIAWKCLLPASEGGYAGYQVLMVSQSGDFSVRLMTRF